MASFNKVVLLGRLAADPELKATASGVSVGNFTLAVNRRFNSDDVDFIRITCWRKTAEVVMDHLSKGSQVLVEGTLESSKWEDQDGNPRVTWGVNASNVTFISTKKKEGAESKTNKGHSDNSNPFTEVMDVPPMDDDIPF